LIDCLFYYRPKLSTKTPVGNFGQKNDLTYFNFHGFAVGIKKYQGSRQRPWHFLKFIAFLPKPFFPYFSKKFLQTTIFLVYTNPIQNKRDCENIQE